MNDSSLIKILSKISSKEMNSFLDFANSPYFTSYAPLQKLVRILCEIHPFNDSKSVEKELIYRQIFPGDNYDYSTLRALFSKTLLLFEQYLAIDLYRKETIRVDNAMLRSLAEKRMDSRFIKKEKNILKALESQKSEDEYLLLNYYEYYKTKDSYYVKNEDYSKRHLLKERTIALDAFYLLEKLKICCEMLNRSLFFKDEIDQEELNHVDHILSKSDQILSRHSLIEIYALIYKTMRFPEEEENYDKLKLHA